MIQSYSEKKLIQVLYLDDLEENLINLENILDDFPYHNFIHKNTWYYWKDEDFSSEDFANIYMKFYEEEGQILERHIPEYAEKLYDFFLQVKEKQLDIYVN